MNVLIEPIRISDTRHSQGFGGANKGPESRAIDLSDDVVGNAIAASRPTRWDLTGDETVEAERLRNDNASTLLELDIPLARR
jgi:hypothetical protein